MPLTDLAGCAEAGLALCFNETFAEFAALRPVRGASATTNTPSTIKARIAISTRFQRRDLAAVPGAGAAKLHCKGP